MSCVARLTLDVSRETREPTDKSCGFGHEVSHGSRGTERVERELLKVLGAPFPPSLSQAGLMLCFRNLEEEDFRMDVHGKTRQNKDHFELSS